MAALLLVVCALFAAFPGLASAHAELTDASPKFNTKLDASPQEVRLTYNESIEPTVGSLEVLDSKSKPVTSAKPDVSKDRKTLSLALPKLGAGVYTVSYHVISADGHPVSGSYIFVVGNPPEAIDAADFNPHKAMGHEGHELPTQLTTAQFLLYAVRIVYYAALLLAAGVALWACLLGGRGGAAAVVSRWEKTSMQALLVAALLFVFFHARELLQGYPGSEYGKLFLQTSVGRDWLALLALALLGFGTLRLHGAVKAAWAAAVLGLESWSGHAAVYSPKALSVLMDFVHLAAAAIWTGGLALLLALWLADRKEAGRFSLRFSRAALFSIAALVVTGVGMAYIFLPGWKYLFYTPWGTLLMIKTGLVVLVLAIGGALHLKVRRGDLPGIALLRVDAALMALIVGVAAIFTYMSPLPANEPVYYHKMGTDMHWTLSISPNKPGDNEFIVKVWLPEKVGAPKSVVLRMKSLDHTELGAINVPLKPYKDQELTSFQGFVLGAYSAEGPYLPFAGRWQAEVRVMDNDDNEKVERYEFRNYGLTKAAD